MNRRHVLLGSLGLLVPSAPAFGEARETSYNFTSGFSSPSLLSPNSGYSGKEIVAYDTNEKPGSIVVDTKERALYLVLEDGEAMRYGVGVGRQGFSWKGAAVIRRKAKWPAWYPPESMRKRELKQNGRKLPKMMKGGPNNPLGARALYLFQGKRDTLYRIHGTNNPKSIGHAMSSGCIRLLNDEVIDLHKRVSIGAKVIVI